MKYEFSESRMRVVEADLDLALAILEDDAMPEYVAVERAAAYIRAVQSELFEVRVAAGEES